MNLISEINDVKNESDENNGIHGCQKIKIILNHKTPKEIRNENINIDSV